MKKTILTLALAAKLLTSSAFALNDYFWYSMAHQTIENGYSSVNSYGSEYSTDLSSFGSSFQSDYLSPGNFADYTAAKASLDSFYDNFNNQKLNNFAWQGTSFASSANELGSMIGFQVLKSTLDAEISDFTTYSESYLSTLTYISSSNYSTQSDALYSYYQSVPEPSTYGLIGIGALGVAFAARRRKVKAA